MSLHRRAGKRGTTYIVRWREGDRNRSRSFDNLEEAEEFDILRRREKRMGAFARHEPSSMRLSDFLARWMQLDGPTWKRTTAINRASLLDRWIEPMIGQIPLRELGRSRIKEFRADLLAAGNSAVNTNNIIRCLSAALAAAEDEGLIPVNPCIRIVKIPEPEPNRQTIHPTHLRLLLLGAPTERDRLIIALCGFAALRPAEIVALRWEDIDGDWIGVAFSYQEGERGPVKNERPRLVPIGPALKPLLTDGAASAGGLVAPSNAGTEIDWSNWTRDVWRPLRERCGMSTVFYSLRHTCISRWIMDGHDPLTVSGWAGHGPEVTQRVYAKPIRQSRGRSSRSGPEAPAASA